MKPAIVVLSILVGVGGCQKRTPVDALPELSQDALLTQLAARSMPDTLRARFSVKLKSKPLGIAAPPLGGGLVVARPDRAFLTVLNPVGSPILTVATDGRGLSFLNTRDRQAFREDDVAGILGTSAAGQVTVPELIGVLVGLVPITASDLARTRRDGDAVRVQFKRAEGVVVRAWVDPVRGTPRRVEVEDRKGRSVVEADYAVFEADGDGPLMPTRVTLFVPSVELTVDLRYKTWVALDAPPDVFAPAVPEGWSTLPMSDFAKGLANVAAGASPE